MEWTVSQSVSQSVSRLLRRRCLDGRRVGQKLLHPSVRPFVFSAWLSVSQWQLCSGKTLASSAMPFLLPSSDEGRPYGAGWRGTAPSTITRAEGSTYLVYRTKALKQSLAICHEVCYNSNLIVKVFLLTKVSHAMFLLAAVR